MVVLRKAIPGDAVQLSELAERTFRDTFGPANTPENMDLHCRSSYGERIQAEEIANPDMFTVQPQDFSRRSGHDAIGCAAPAKLRETDQFARFLGEQGDPQRDIVMMRAV